MSQSTFNLETILELPNIEERQSAIIHSFNQAMEEEDYLTAHHIAELVISDERLSIYCPASFQAHLWRWLFTYLKMIYSETEEDSQEEEEVFSQIGDALWKAKWIIVALPNDLAIDKEEIQTFNQEIITHYQEVGLSLTSLHKALMEQSIKLGDIEATHHHFQQWQSTEEDNFPDCEACQQDSLMVYYHFIGDYSRAIEAAMPILNGQMYCGEVPHLTYYPAIDSLIRLNRKEEAKQHLDKATTLITQEVEGFAHLIAKLAQLHIRLDNHNKAVELLEEYFDNIVKASLASPLYAMHYLMARMTLEPEIEKQALALAKAFDERNGNQHYQTQLELMQLSPENFH